MVMKLDSVDDGRLAAFSKIELSMIKMTRAYKNYFAEWDQRSQVCELVTKLGRAVYC